MARNSFCNRRKKRLPSAAERAPRGAVGLPLGPRDAHADARGPHATRLHGGIAGFTIEAMHCMGRR